MTEPSTTSPTRVRPDLLWRAVVPVAALVALALSAPQPVSGGLALASLGLAAERLARLRSSSTADRVLVALGGGTVVVVLLGMLMGSTPIGLSRQTWVVALALASIVGLAVAAVLPARVAPVRDAGLPAARPDHRRTALLLVPWLATSVVVVAVAVQVSTTSLVAADRQPLQVGFGRISGTQVQVVVSTSDPIGPLEVRTSADGNDVSYPLLDLDRDGSATTTLALPTTGRFLVTVNYPDQTKPLRTLVLDR